MDAATASQKLKVAWDDLDASRRHFTRRVIEIGEKQKKGAPNTQAELRSAFKVVLLPALERFFMTARTLPPNTPNLREILIHEYLNAAQAAEQAQLPPKITELNMVDAKEIANAHCRLALQRIRGKWGGEAYAELVLAVMTAQALDAMFLPSARAAEAYLNEFQAKHGL